MHVDKIYSRTHKSSKEEDAARTSHGKYPKAIVVRDTSSELDRDLDKDSEWKKEVMERRYYKP